MAIDRPTFGGVNVGNISTGANEFSDKLMDLGFKLNAQDRLKQEDKLREEQLRYSRENDAFNRNRIINADKTAQEERDYLLGQRKNKEAFMQSVANPSADALDDTIINRTNELAASKWNESNPISDAEASRLNDYYARNEKILNPTMDQENLRSYIGSQALKYGVDPSTATSTYEMFKPDKKETGLTDMEKLLIQNELGMQRDVNKLNAEKALGNEKYDGKSGNTTTGAKKDKAGAIGSDFASNAAELNKLELDTDVIDSLGATSEKEKALSLYTNLSKTYNPKDVTNVIKASIGSGGEINDDTVKTLLSNIPTNVSKSDASSPSGALEKVEYKPAIDLQSMIAKSTKVDKGKLAEDMFEREFGIPKGKSGGSSSNDNESGRVPIVDKNGKVSRVEGIPDSLQLNEGLKLKAYDDAGGLAVGYGYNYSTKSTPELIKDFKQAGLSDYLLEDAAAGKKITLTKDEANRLAQVAYKNHGTDKADKLINSFDKLDPIMKEIASDMAYRGDLVPGENGYRGTLSNLIEQGDINKLYEYVDNSSKVPQAVKNRLGNILTVERDRPIQNLIDESNSKLPSKAPVDGDTKDISSNEQNQKEKDEFETKISDIRNQFQDKRSKLNDDLQLRFKNGDLSYFDNTLSKIGKQKEQRDLDNEEKNSIKNLVNMSKDKNGTKLTKYEEMENDAKEYDKKEKEDYIVKKQIQLQINELKNDPSIVNEYESAWRSEARKRGLQGTDIIPFSINEFIKSLTPEKINEIRNKYQ